MEKKYLFPLVVLVLSIAAYFVGQQYQSGSGGKAAQTDVGQQTTDQESLSVDNDDIEQRSEQPRLGTNTTGLPLQMPDGFSISIFARDVPGARVMLFDPKGRMLVSQTQRGRIAVLTNTDGDPESDSADALLSGLNQPHGMAFDCSSGLCKLYVAETNQVSMYDYDAEQPAATNKRKLFDLPSGAGHFTRTIIIKDQKLYTSVGSSCNVCSEADSRRATILSSNLDGSDLKVYASGLRNSVFMAWHPVSGKMWATENSRDNLGDDVPPDEVNIVEEGKHYGWPTCYDDNIHDTNFDKNVYIQNPCSDKAAPHIKIQAHSAALGLAFVPEEGWPEDWRHDLLVAYHGSWNRSVPTGYKVVRFRLDENGNVQGSEDFLAGFLTGVRTGDALGRPVDVLVQPGGVVYISDDKAGLIYRVVYQN